MNQATAKPGPPASKPGLSSFPAIAPINPLLLDKLNARTRTPDSEALASSDEEPDSSVRHEFPQSITQTQKPVRRGSWLTENPQPPIAKPRKGSFASSSMSPTTSHPSTPSAESGVAAWGSHSTPSAMNSHSRPGTGTFPWGNALWNTERKDPPPRLAEMLPSPTSTLPPGGAAGYFIGTDSALAQSSSAAAAAVAAARENAAGNSQIPFAIPLHPTPKTYRSQSYSVGQLDPDTAPSAIGSAALMGGGRGRGAPHSVLQHRPSRPSMLSEMSSEGGPLGKLKEVDDDDEESGSGSVQDLQSAEAKTIEMLTRENAMLRQQQQQQQQQQQHYNSRLRTRASASGTYGIGNGYSLAESVPEESDYAIDELEESNDGGSDIASKRALRRRMSEYTSSGGFRSPYENRKIENVKKGIWQSSLGFPGLGDPPQSRRHSFAEIPTRQASISSISEAAAAHEAASLEGSQTQDYPAYPENAGYTTGNPVASYFGPTAGLPAVQQALAQPPFPNPYQAAQYGLPNQFAANRPNSPHRNMYGMPQPRHNQSLHVVLFKCARADVFYIQEGTGLTVKPGDLVIVEADRGTDLGTVAKDNVDWQTAKDLKEHYAEEHYKWLMMYSQNAAAAQEGGAGAGAGAGAGLMAASNGLQGSAVGGMGPAGQHHLQEPNAGELKPKLIKRLAQSHEIHALRDKEGNEAKAKRVCMQKVKEHGLNMEILDAEFQMDWKKLTFYYFADSYINFNSLVTDLFKIYKTRIWMSAINPASFANHTTLGLQAPSGIGPGAVGVGGGRGSGNTERRREQPQQEQAAQAFNAPAQAGRPPFQPSFGPSFTNEPAATVTAAYANPNYPYAAAYGAFSNAARPGPGLPYMPGMMPAMGQYPPGFAAQQPDYQAALRGRFPAESSGPGSHDQQQPGISPQADWLAGGFQGLSLNSR